MKKPSAIALLLALALAFTAAFAAQALSAVNLALSFAFAAPDAKTGVAIGAAAPDFTLPDADGEEHSLASLKGSKGTVIIFVATLCPISNAYNERMRKLAEDYRARGVNVVGINSNSTEPAAEVKTHTAEKGLTFTILKDAGNQIADRFNAQVTPEAYVLDASGKLVYHGRIDNSRYGYVITASELHDAIEATLAGKPVEKAEAKAFGCSIKRG
ncbi:MAG TPA: thioredoxin family protein [Pyrinomonadaceae bacterium]|jgi:peroxiredoxin